MALIACSGWEIGDLDGLIVGNSGAGVNLGTLWPSSGTSGSKRLEEATSGRYRIELAADNYLEGYTTYPTLRPAATELWFNFLIWIPASGGVTTKRALVVGRQVGLGYQWALGTEAKTSPLPPTAKVKLLFGDPPSTTVGATSANLGVNTAVWINLGVRLSDGYAKLYAADTLIQDWVAPPNTPVAGLDGVSSLYSKVVGTGNAAVVYYSSVIITDDTGTQLVGRLTSAYKNVVAAQPICDVTNWNDFTAVSDADKYGNIDDDNDDGFVSGDLNRLAASTTGNQASQVATIPTAAGRTVEGAVIWICQQTSASYQWNPGVDKVMAYLEDPSGAPPEFFDPYRGAEPGDVGAYHWVPLVSPPGGGDWTLAKFNQLGIGVRRDTSSSQGLEIRKIYAEAIGQNLVRPTATATPTGACMSDAPPVAGGAAFTPRVMII